jgi:hypothetical protein
MYHLTKQQLAVIHELSELQAWAKGKGLTLTKDNAVALMALKNNQRTMNSRRPII